MATFVLTDASILLGGVDLTDKSNQIGLTYEAEARDNTTFGSGGTRSNTGGLFVLSAEVGGFTDDTLSGASLFNEVGAAAAVFQVSSPGDDGDVGYAFKSMGQSHTPLSGSVGDMATDSLSLVGRSGDPLVRGTILLPTTSAITATGTGTGRQVGSVASGQSAYAALNVVSVSGTSPTLDVTLQSDDNSGFSSPVSRATFTQATSTGGQWTSVAGVVSDDWWRVSYTVGGSSPSFTFQVLVGIR